MNLIEWVRSRFYEYANDCDRLFYLASGHGLLGIQISRYREVRLLLSKYYTETFDRKKDTTVPIISTESGTQ